MNARDDYPAVAFDSRCAVPETRQQYVDALDEIDRLRKLLDELHVAYPATAPRTA